MKKLLSLYFLLLQLIFSCQDIDDYYSVDSSYNSCSFQLTGQTRGCQEKDYVEICGVKWAKGNLQYCTQFDEDGWQKGWSLASNQWYYFNTIYGKVQETFIQDIDSIDHFNWGVCGSNALTTEKLYATNFTGDISGKMYTNRTCTKEITDFEKASYGDIAYWASKGQWRMPNTDELKSLYDSASYSPAIYYVNDSNFIYGFYFTDPNGMERVVSTKARIITDNDMEDGLFLPGAGFRNKTDSTIMRAGDCGFYWQSMPNADNAGSAMGLRFIIYNAFWSSDGRGYGRSIRPVLVENQRKDYVDVCGVKWSKGNLQYIKGYIDSDTTFRKNWRFAPTQYHRLYNVSGRHESSFKQSLDSVEHFNFGLVGSNALLFNKTYATVVSDGIYGKMFTNKSCTKETNDFESALYGDLIYWATNGKWRFPTQEEIHTLLYNASYQPAIATTDDGVQVWGFYFFTPINGNRLTTTTTRYITDTDLDNGLFLPSSGIRERSSDEINRVGACGFYWQSNDSTNDNIGSMNALKYSHFTLSNSSSARSYGRCLRGVLNE